MCFLVLFITLYKLFIKKQELCYKKHASRDEFIEKTKLLIKKNLELPQAKLVTRIWEA